jgi:hypothetical protein
MPISLALALEISTNLLVMIPTAGFPSFSRLTQLPATAGAQLFQ